MKIHDKTISFFVRGYSPPQPHNNYAHGLCNMRYSRMFNIDTRPSVCDREYFIIVAQTRC